MCGLKASDVREELVSAAAREAEWDFVYGEIKPVARGGFFATLAGRRAWACWRLRGCCGPQALQAGYLVRVRVRSSRGRAWCTVPYAPSSPDLLPAAWPRGTLLRCTRPQHAWSSRMAFSRLKTQE